MTRAKQIISNPQGFFEVTGVGYPDKGQWYISGAEGIRKAESKLAFKRQLLRRLGPARVVKVKGVSNIHTDLNCVKPDQFKSAALKLARKAKRMFYAGAE